MHHEAHRVGRRTEHAGCQTNPVHHVETVLPSHLNVLAVALTVSVKVGQQDVVVEEMVVDACNHKHRSGVVGISVHQYSRCAMRLGRTCKDSVRPFARRHHHEGVAQGTLCLQAVNPRAQFGIVGYGTIETAVTMARRIHQRIVDQIERTRSHRSHE